MFLLTARRVQTCADRHGFRKREFTDWPQFDRLPVDALVCAVVKTGAPADVKIGRIAVVLNRD
jgi:hypothetical protein